MSVNGIRIPGKSSLFGKLPIRVPHALTSGIINLLDNFKYSNTDHLLSSDGKLLALGSSDYAIRLLDGSNLAVSIF